MRVCIVSASHQNVFFGELLDAFVSGLESEGVAVERAVDHFPAPQADLVYLFVPHEYVHFTERDSHPTPRQLRRSVALCTEQPGTPWFEEGARVAADAGAVVDINELGVAELRRRGIDARLVPLGYVPGWDRWHGDPDSARPVDLTFVGGHTDRRALALARCGRVLRGRPHAFHLFRTVKPHHAADRWVLSGDGKWAALAETKAMLNVHRSHLAYLEWPRFVDAICNGCVVVSEHSIGDGLLVPGEHYVSAGYDDLHLAVAALLEEPDRLTALREAAYRLLREERPLAMTVEALMTALEDVHATGSMAPDPGEPVPRPRPRAPVVPEPDHFKPEPGGTERRALKQLILEVTELRRQVSSARDGDAPDVVEAFGPRSACEARVSVVITLYNYADHIREAIASVARADYDAYELLVIDDASTDGSADVAREALAAASWLPSRLVTRPRNAGLPAGRNLGFELARAPYVFVMDADNVLYPRGLSLLAEALDADPGASFAYGILENFDDAGPQGLLSWLGWDAFWLRYDNPVDAMALLRRDDVLEVGGYTHEPALHGWEDYALWCALATAGRRGTSVPSIVAGYRTAHDSMMATASIDKTAAWAALYRRYPAIFAPAAS